MNLTNNDEGYERRNTNFKMPVEISDLESEGSTYFNKIGSSVIGSE